MTMTKQKTKRTNDVISNIQPVKVSDELLIEEINPDINPDETNDFDLTPEKKPALSSMKQNLKDLEKRGALTVLEDNFVQRFDKLKIAVDLRAWEAIDFDFDIDTSNMFKCVYPEKPDTWAEEKKRRQKQEEELLEKFEASELVIEQNTKAIPEFEDLDEFLDMNSEEEFEETEDEKENFKEASHGLNIKYYPNCKIKYSERTRNRTRGLNNVYIKNNYLFICVTGKFMGTSETLGYITQNNIIEVLEKVQNLAGFRFNIESLLTRAVVYICHLCIDLLSFDIAKDINALSSLFPLASNKHVIRKYGRHGLQLKSRAKNTGSSLVFYNKMIEIQHNLQRLLQKINMENSDKPITMEQLKVMYNYPKNLDLILRVELQIYKLQEMRVLLNIPTKEAGMVYLTDVLNSTATPILKRFEAFGATEEILREKIAGYVEIAEQNETEIRTYTELRNRLAGERIALLLKDNGFNILRVRSHLIVEYGIDNDSLLSSLTTDIKKDLWNFLLYRKPKAIKRVLNILDKVHTYYGRGANDDE